MRSFALSSTERHFSLFVPGLFGPSSAGTSAKEAATLMTEGLELAALEALLSRASRVPSPGVSDNLEGMLFQYFGIEEAPRGDWPAAAVTRMVDKGTRDPAWFMRADPVHLRADMNVVTLLDASTFSLSEAEAEILAGEIREHCSNVCDLQVLHPKRWYLTLRDEPRVRTRSPTSAWGMPLDECLPQGEDVNKWRVLLNEVQMILHASPVNAERASRGEPVINSVWFWGGGALPTMNEARWCHVWTQEVLAWGLARLSGIPSADVPAGGAQLLENATIPGEHLVVLDAGYRFAQLADVEAWRNYLATLHQNWFVPLYAALKSRQITSITILTGGDNDFRVSATQLRYVWRRRRAFATFMERS